MLAKSVLSIQQNRPINVKTLCIYGVFLTLKAYLKYILNDFACCLNTGK
ncbi:hypothetical protein CRENPOLYSF1_190051 [Crenothrix polyspora]|uniref:Uncharacterized protein n=1 Tax=Crenothrix polyspora TaxID=360316 RepID=A0A1R4H548_9GAMM|nr:hypothetical protein CRENPOLYSF1_190051 [Crenothrix polyspora]